MISDEERVLKFAVKFDAETAGQTNQMLIMALIITLISNFRKALLRARTSERKIKFSPSVTLRDQQERICGIHHLELLF